MQNDSLTRSTSNSTDNTNDIGSYRSSSIVQQAAAASANRRRSLSDVNGGLGMGSLNNSLQFSSSLFGSVKANNSSSISVNNSTTTETNNGNVNMNNANIGTSSGGNSWMDEMYMGGPGLQTQLNNGAGGGDGGGGGGGGVEAGQVNPNYDPRNTRVNTPLGMRDTHGNEIGNAYAATIHHGLPQTKLKKKKTANSSNHNQYLNKNKNKDKKTNLDSEGIEYVLGQGGRPRSMSDPNLGNMDEEYVPPNRPEGWVGAYSPDRFLAKRQHRVWTKKVKYDVRKNFADSRMRVKGRFVKKEEEVLMRELMSLT